MAYEYLELELVAREQRTPDICLAAVKKNGNNIIYVPEDLRTPEICSLAVNHNGDNLNIVPEKYKTPELCLKAVQNIRRDQRDQFHLNAVPEDLRTQEICSLAVNYNGFNLYYVPKKYKTARLCLEAVQNAKGQFLLRSVPEQLRTPEICLEAVRIDYHNLAFVPEKFKNERIYLEAVKNGFPLRRVLDQFKTKMVCLVAFLKNPESIHCSPFSEAVLLDLEKTLTEERKTFLMASEKRLPNLKTHGPHFEAKFKKIISSFSNEFSEDISQFDKYKRQAEAARVERLAEPARVERERLEEPARVERLEEVARVETERQDEEIQGYAAAAKDASSPEGKESPVMGLTRRAGRRKRKTCKRKRKRTKRS